MIRASRLEDSDTLVALTRATGVFKPLEIQALREVLDDFFETNHREGHLSVTAERDGDIVGFAYYAPAAMTVGSWHLWWIAVGKEHQGGGVGRALLEYVEQDVRARKGHVLFIETGSLPAYEQTRRFYLKNGYEQHAVLKDHYAVGDSMVVFRKGLS
jgi:GNAT superfamily N-acetyltransferase